MTSSEIREKYFNFFEKRGHIRIEPSPLVLEGDPTTLFTSSGMQQLVPYLKGEPHPKGRRLVDLQPSIRAQGKNDDIFEVGDSRHLTYFEMLGNWSLGDYFKAEQLAWIWEFFTKELGLESEKLHVTVFAGTKDVPQDLESVEIWKKIGVPSQRIHFYPAQKNWWSRSGVPEEMPAGEIGGPDSEVFYEFEIPHDPRFGKDCHPNCDCGKFIEIGNSVFIQYQKKSDGSLSELPQKNVDFGGGLERITMAVEQTPDMFAIDIYKPIIEALERETLVKYGSDQRKDRSMRILADHLRASMMLISGGVVPANKMHGYVLRKLLRRAIFHLHLLGVGLSGRALAHIAEGLKRDNRKIAENWDKIKQIVSEEGVKFGNTLENGLRKLTRIIQTGQVVDGKLAFDLYQTDGFPLELTLEILKENGIDFKENAKSQFKKEFEKHRELSRTASIGLFKGGLVDTSKRAIKLHTATHLLQAALRQILGEGVSQKGSNITAERLRFDFSHDSKLTNEEIKKVEDLINEQIRKDLPVTCEIKTFDQAVAEGALHFFAEKYGKEVKVYSINNFSKEICGGPHVSRTGEIGGVRITRQEKIGSGIIRIYATLF